MMSQCKKLWKQFLYEVDKAMDEQFEKTENSMSIYYTVNKMLIALHMALLVFFVVMRVYVMEIGRASCRERV